MRRRLFNVLTLLSLLLAFAVAGLFALCVWWVGHALGLEALPDALWFVVSCSMVSAIVALYAWAAYSSWKDCRRTPPGLCVKCGYDLRASKDKCPECGEPVPKPEEAKT